MRSENKNAIKLSFQLVHGCISSSVFLLVAQNLRNEAENKFIKSVSEIKSKFGRFEPLPALSHLPSATVYVVRIRCACMTHHKMSYLREGATNKQFCV